MRVRIKEILEEKERTIYWLAQKTGYTYKSLYNLCNNKTYSLKFMFLERICNALEVTPNDIFDFEK